MVRDTVFKLIGVLLLGFMSPFSAHLFTFHDFPSPGPAILFTFFMLPSFLIWQGSLFLLSWMRNTRIRERVFLKLICICFSTALYAIVLAALSLLLWNWLFDPDLQRGAVLRSCLSCAALVVVFSLVYEILFLDKERQIDGQVVTHLDRELMQAEISVLRNELDPHFVYNSLMPLYYLIKNDVQKAEAFAYRLIQVYQYFLENRQNDFITLHEELKFIEHYIFLLQIRYKDAVFLSVDINGDTRKLLVLPLSLQVLVENVIKHNEFDKMDPLYIRVYCEKNQLVVANDLRGKSYEMNSTRIGLKNLRDRYKILASSDITVVRNKDLFMVKIPLIRNSKTYDVNSYNRG